MKKIISVSILGLLFATSLPLGVQAASQFTTPLGYGAKSAQVVQLQNFLIEQGFLKSTASGSYFGLTQKAVAAFQTSQHITPASGYFGPATMAAANKILAGKGAASTGTGTSVAPTSAATSSGAATVSVGSVSNANSALASAAVATDKTVTWSTTGYPADAGVNINLLRKISDSPVSYAFVRSIAKDTPDDGKQTWTPSLGETGSGYYVEVTCSSTYHFAKGCHLTGAPTPVN